MEKRLRDDKTDAVESTLESFFQIFFFSFVRGMSRGDMGCWIS